MLQKASDVWIFVILSLVIVALGVLFYLKFVVYKGTGIGGIRRVASTVQLIPNDGANEMN